MDRRHPMTPTVFRPAHCLALSLVIASCSHRALPPLPSVHRIDARHYPDTDWVWLDRDADLVLEAPRAQRPRARWRLYGRIQVLREGPAKLPLGLLGQRVRAIQGRRIDASGNVHPLPADSLRHLRQSDGTVRSELVAPALRPGDVLDFRYETVRWDLRFLSAWYFAAPEPVLSSRFSVTAVPAFQLRVQAAGGGPIAAPTAIRSDPAKGQRQAFRIEHLPALPPDDRGDAFARQSPRVAVLVTKGPGFIPLSSWPEFYAWWAQTERFTAAPEPWRRRAQRAATGSTPLQRALRLRRWFQTEFRTTPQSPGRPPAPIHWPTLWKTRVVPPRAAGLVLSALLNAAGIESVPAIVSFRRHRAPDLDFFHWDDVAATAARVVAQTGLYLDPGYPQSTDIAVRLQGGYAIHGLDDAPTGVSLPPAPLSASRLSVDWHAIPRGADGYTIRGGIRAAGPIADILTATHRAHPTGERSPALQSALQDYLPMPAARIALTPGSANEAALEARFEADVACPNPEVLACFIAPPHLGGYRRTDTLLWPSFSARLSGTIQPREDAELKAPTPANTEWPGGTAKLRGARDAAGNLRVTLKFQHRASRASPGGWRRRQASLRTVAEWLERPLVR